MELLHYVSGKTDEPGMIYRCNNRVTLVERIRAQELHYNLPADLRRNGINAAIGSRNALTRLKRGETA